MNCHKVLLTASLFVITASSACTTKHDAQASLKDTQTAQGKPASPDLQDVSAFMQLMYNSNTNELSAYANFNEFTTVPSRGDSLKLIAPAAISFDTTELEYHGVTLFTAGDYSLKKNEDYSNAEHKFLLTRGDGKAFEYNTKLPEPIQLQSSELSLSKGLSFTLSRPAEGEERIECGLASTDKKIEASTWSTGGNVCSFTARQVEFFKLEADKDYTFHFYVYKTSSGLEGIKDGHMTVMYIGKVTNAHVIK